VYAVLESVRLAAYLLSIIPNVSNDIYQQLGFAIDFNETTQISLRLYTTGVTKVKQKLGEPDQFFQRLITTIGFILAVY